MARHRRKSREPAPPLLINYEPVPVLDLSRATQEDIDIYIGTLVDTAVAKFTYSVHFLAGVSVAGPTTGRTHILAPNMEISLCGRKPKSGHSKWQRTKVDPPNCEVCKLKMAALIMSE